MHESRSRVFVTQENDQLNYSHAEQFGEVVFLTRDDVSPVAGSLTNSAIIEQLKSKLSTFDFEHDYIAPSGSPTVCGLAFFVLADRASFAKCLRVLRWSNRDRCYQPITLPVQ